MTDYDIIDSDDVDGDNLVHANESMWEAVQALYGFMPAIVQDVVYAEVSGQTYDSLCDDPYTTSQRVNLQLRRLATTLYRRPDYDAGLHAIITKQVKFYTQEVPSYSQYVTAFFDLLACDGFCFVGEIIRNGDSTHGSN